MSAPANWGFPTDVWFGAGRVRDLPKAVRSLRSARPLLVTDRGLRDLPMIAAAMADLERDGFEVGLFADVKPNPTAANVKCGFNLRDAAAPSFGCIEVETGSGNQTSYSRNDDNQRNSPPVRYISRSVNNVFLKEIQQHMKTDRSQPAQRANQESEYEYLLVFSNRESNKKLASFDLQTVPVDILPFRTLWFHCGL